MSAVNDKIEFCDVSFSYGDKKIFSNLNLLFSKGLTVIRGKSGLGKSTLLKMIMGFLFPVSGKVSVGNMLLGRDTCWDIRRITAFVPQDFSVPVVSAKGFVEEIGRLKSNRHINNFYQRVIAGADVLGLGKDLMLKDLATLSGGERQRLFFAIAVAMDRPFVLMDEPTSALDIKNAEIVVEEAEKLGGTVVVISHDDVWLHANARVIDMEELI